MVGTQDGSIQHGKSAALSGCRVNNAALQKSALLQIFNNKKNKSTSAGIDVDDVFETSILFGPLAVLAHFCNSAENLSGKDISGMVAITSNQLLFWETTNVTLEATYDLRVDAVCIDLHALTTSAAYDDDEYKDAGIEGEIDTSETDNPPSIVYIQMSTGGDDDDDIDHSEDETNTNLFELSLLPLVGDSISRQALSNQLFHAISKLISLNPINPNDIEESGCSDFSMSRDWEYNGPVSIQPQHFDDDSDQDDLENSNMDNMFVGLSSRMTSGEVEATDEERNAMLERLDKLLIVPEEYEISDVQEMHEQFEDAAEDSDSDLI